MAQKQRAYEFPQKGLVRESDILATVFRCGKTFWREGVKSGKFPQPIKYGRLNFWRAEEVWELVESISNGGAA